MVTIFTIWAHSSSSPPRTHPTPTFYFRDFVSPQLTWHVITPQTYVLLDPSDQCDQGYLYHMVSAYSDPGYLGQLSTIVTKHQHWLERGNGFFELLMSEASEPYELGLLLLGKCMV